MKFVIVGGTGQVGTLLTRSLVDEGHLCVVLSRHPDMAALPASASVCSWDGLTLGDWCRELEGADVVVNLAGRSVNCRYSEAHLDELLRSRVDSTRLVGEAIARAQRPPKLWLQSATATIYTHRFDASNDDVTGVIGGREPSVPEVWHRIVEIALAWEAAQRSAITPDTRQVALRMAMVMSPDRGGVFDVFAGLCRLGMGRQDDGQQFVSWIHEHDFIAAVKWIVTHEGLEGPINLCSPQPLPNRDFIAILHQVLRQPISIPVPAWLLEIGAYVRRTETELLLKSRRVVPARLLDSGFIFRYPAWSDAAKDLADRWRRRTHSPSTVTTTSRV